MVDTLSSAIRVVEIDGSQLVATEADVEVISESPWVLWALLIACFWPIFAFHSMIIGQQSTNQL
ncbi:TPA: hypothetical protein ACNIGS_001517 [Pseudomonas aeruginosa]